MELVCVYVAQALLYVCTQHVHIAKIAKTVLLYKANAAM